MILPPDLRDLLVAFAVHHVEYLLVGGYAVAVHATPRYTKDLDLWIANTPENLNAVASALEDFGAPPQVTAQLHAAAELDVLWFGAVPNRIDLLKSVPGGDFVAMYARRQQVDIDGLSVSVITKPDLKHIKLASGRPQDLVDAGNLD
jgi:predicted nucleotidyltransferase